MRRRPGVESDDFDFDEDYDRDLDLGGGPLPSAGKEKPRRVPMPKLRPVAAPDPSLANDTGYVAESVNESVNGIDATTEPVQRNTASELPDLEEVKAAFTETVDLELHALTSPELTEPPTGGSPEPEPEPDLDLAADPELDLGPDSAVTPLIIDVDAAEIDLTSETEQPTLVEPASFHDSPFDLSPPLESSEAFTPTPPVKPMAADVVIDDDDPFRWPTEADVAPKRGAHDAIDPSELDDLLPLEVGEPETVAPPSNPVDTPTPPETTAAAMLTQSANDASDPSDTSFPGLTDFAAEQVAVSPTPSPTAPFGTPESPDADDAPANADDAPANADDAPSGETDAARPDAARPDAARSDAGRSDAGRSDAARPDVAHHDGYEPGAVIDPLTVTPDVPAAPAEPLPPPSVDLPADGDAESLRRTDLPPVPETKSAALIPPPDDWAMLSRAVATDPVDPVELAARPRPAPPVRNRPKPPTGQQPGNQQRSGELAPSQQGDDQSAVAKASRTKPFATRPADPPAIRVDDEPDDVTDGIFYGWVLVAAVFVILAITSGIGFYNASVILSAATNELDTSVGAVSGATGLFFAISGLTGFAFSKQMETVDIRWFFALGGMVGAIALVGLQWVSSVVHLYIFFAVFGMGFALAGLVPATTLVTRWFDRRRSVALSVASTGLSVGGIAVTPISAWLISNRTLSGASPYLAALWVIGIVPIAMLLVRSYPSEKGLAPDGGPAPKRTKSLRPANPVGPGSPVGPMSAAETTSVDDQGDPGIPGLDFGTARTTRFFMSLCIAYAVIFFGQVGAIAQLFNMTFERTNNNAAATAAVSTLAFASVAARLAGGAIVLRVSTQLFTAILAVAQAIALVLLALAPSSATLILSAALFGISVGNLLMLQPLLLAEAFGVKNYGRIYGFNQLFGTLGVAGGPFILGVLRDAFDYRSAFFVAATASFVGFVFIMLAGPMSAVQERWSTPATA